MSSTTIYESDYIEQNFYANSSFIPEKIWHRNTKNRNFFKKQQIDTQELFEITLTNMQPTYQSNNLNITVGTGFQLTPIDQEQAFLLNYLSEIFSSLTLVIPTTNQNYPIKLLGNSISLSPGIGLFYFGNLELVVSTFQRAVVTLATNQRIDPTLVFNFLDAQSLEQDPFSQNYCLYFLQLSNEMAMELLENNIYPIGFVSKVGYPQPISLQGTIIKEGFSFSAQTKDENCYIQPIKILDHDNISSFYFLELPLHYNTYYDNFYISAFENNDQSTSSNGIVHYSVLGNGVLNDLSLFCNTNELYTLLENNIVDDETFFYINFDEDPYYTEVSDYELVIWREIENSYILSSGKLSVSWDFSFETEITEMPEDPENPGGGETPTPDENAVMLYSNRLSLTTDYPEYNDIDETGNNDYGEGDEGGIENGNEPYYRISGNIPISPQSIYSESVYLTPLNPADCNNQEDHLHLYSTVVANVLVENDGEDNSIFSAYFNNEPPETIYAFSFISQSTYENSALDHQQAIQITGEHHVYIVCLSPDTLITMADFSQRQIKDLTTNDIVLSKNKTPQRIIKLDIGKPSNISDYYYFDDGTVIHTTNPHRFFNIEQGFYQYLHEWKIGEHAQKLDGTTTALVRRETIEEDSICCGIWTEDRTCWANGLLSSETAANEELLQTMDLNSAKNMLKTIIKEKIRKALR